jgi:flagellar hook-length control protein FliK
MLGIFAMLPVRPMLTENAKTTPAVAVNTVAPVTVASMPYQAVAPAVATNVSAPLPDVKLTAASQAPAADAATVRTTPATPVTAQSIVFADALMQQPHPGQAVQAPGANQEAKPQTFPLDMAAIPVNAVSSVPGAVVTAAVMPTIKPVPQPAASKPQSAQTPVAATPVIAETTDALPVKDATPTGQTTIQNPVIAPTAAAGTGDKSNSGFSADIFADTEPVAALQDTTANNTPVSFSGLLHQTVKTDQPLAVAPAEPQAATPDTNNVLGQIVDQARLINRPNNSEMIIRLKPEHLGELTLKVVVESGGVSASFMTNNAEVRSVIEASLPQLKQELSTQGLKVDNVGVYASLDQFFANDQRGNAWQGTPKTNAKPKNTEGFIETVEAVSQATPKTSATGIDYRI